jgi:uncharacterized membrane protein
MADLIAIGYPDETTTDLATQEVERLTEDLVIEPDHVAVIKRDKKGRLHVTTTHYEVAADATFGPFWGLLFGALFFIPLLGIAAGAGLGAPIGAVTKLGIDREFENQVKITGDNAIEVLAKYGGTVLKTSLPRDAEQQIQAAAA